MKMKTKINLNHNNTTINSKRMKKFCIPMVAIIGLVATSCSNDEPVAPLSQSAKSEISYSITADAGSRSMTSYANGTDVDRIHVSAWMTKDGVLPGYGSGNTNNVAYFTNDLLTRTSDKGTTTGVFTYSSDMRFWPQNGEALDFFALVDEDKCTNPDGIPASFSWTGGDGDKPGLGWIAQKEAKYMPDLLYAYTPDEKWSGDRTNNYQQNVSFSFNHAFAKVLVTATVKNKNIRIVISDIKIKGVRSKGLFTMPHKTGEGSTNVNQPAYWKTVDEYIGVNGNLAEKVVLMNGDKKDLIGEGNALMMIPGDYNGRNSSKCQTYIELTAIGYNLPDGTFDEDTAPVIYGKVDAAGNVTPFRLCVPIEFKWQMGTVNHYNIVFDCNNGGTTPDKPDPEDPENPDPNDPENNEPGLIKIGYEVEVTPWTDKDHGDYDYPTKK